jgi:CBS domain-containing protein
VVALIRKLAETGAVSDPAALEHIFTDSRIRDIIHIGPHVLLPHLRTGAVDGLVVALGVAAEPLPADTDRTEGGARIVVLVLAAPSAASLYLQTVAALARTLRHDPVVESLLAARTPEEVLAVAEIRELMIQPRLLVRDVMTQRVYRVAPDAPLRKLVSLMSEHRLRAVPVVGEQREVLGLVTDRDLLRYLMPHVIRIGAENEATRGGPGAIASGATARDVMSRTVMCISEDQPLAEVANIMLTKDVERLPVVSEGQLTGFLTRGDIIRKLFGL